MASRRRIDLTCDCGVVSRHTLAFLVHTRCCRGRLAAPAGTIEEPTATTTTTTTNAVATLAGVMRARLAEVSPSELRGDAEWLHWQALRGSTRPVGGWAATMTPLPIASAAAVRAVAAVAAADDDAAVAPRFYVDADAPLGEFAADEPVQGMFASRNLLRPALHGDAVADIANGDGDEVADIATLQLARGLRLVWNDGAADLLRRVRRKRQRDELALAFAAAAEAPPSSNNGREESGELAPPPPRSTAPSRRRRLLLPRPAFQSFYPD